MMFSPVSRLADGKLITEVNMLTVEPRAEFACYLYEENAGLLEKQLYTKKPSFVFDVSKTGKYYARVFVRVKKEGSNEYAKLAKNTNKVIFYANEIWEDFRQFLETEHPLNVSELPFSKNTAPGQDLLLAVVSAEPQAAVLESYAGEMGMHQRRLASWEKNQTQHIVVTATGEPLYIEGGCCAAISGMGRTRERLIFGMSDLDSMETANACSEQVGTFCLLRADPQKLTLESDYFGVNKLYYYRREDLFLVSNRVHLLLLVLRRLGVKGEPNFDKIHAYLSGVEQLTMQNFSRELNLKNLFCLPVDSRIRIDLVRGRIEIEKTGLYYDLVSPMAYDEQLYRQMLQQAADELVDNARIALERPEFEHAIVHVTGGLDSRLTYCALTRLPQYRDKLIAYTRKTAAVPRDFEVAARLLSKYPIPWNKVQFGQPVEQKVNQNLRALSFSLGTTTEGGGPGKQLPYKDTCVLSGAYGEIVARPYYTRSYFDGELDDSVLSIEEFYHRMFFQKKTLLSDEVSLKHLCETFARETAQLPGRTNMEKHENHYLFYRNGLHFHTAHASSLAPEWGILQSKTLFKLKYMTYPLNRGIQLQLDILYLLNPELAAVEFEGERDQLERRALHEKYGRYPECDEYDEQLIEQLKEAWTKNSKFNAGAIDNSLEKGIIASIYTRETLLEILHALITMLDMNHETAITLYWYIRYAEIKSKQFTYLSRKLFSLYYELTI